MPSPFGVFVRCASLGVSPDRRRSLLPLPVEELVRAGSARYRGSPSECEDVASWFRLVGHALNYLGSGAGGSGQGRGPPRMANPAQRRAIDRLVVVLLWFLAEDDDEPPLLDEVFRDAKEKKFSYGGELVTCRRDLVAEKVIPTWPQLGEVGILELEDMLDGELKTLVGNPWSCLRPRDEWPEVPHKSQVHATQAEWDALAAEGLRRGIFREVDPDKVFRGLDGSPVVSGAMGVDKFKEEGGITQHYLRFITIMTPLNQHLREIRGEVDFLPYIAHAMLIILGPDDEAVVDSEDFVSCFNLVRMPRSWDGFLAYSRPVSGEVLGRQAGSKVHVGITTVPMGWSGAVAVIQAVVRRLVFGDAAVDVQTEIAKCKEFPQGPNYSLVYLDSFDYIRVRCRKAVAGEVGHESPEHARFCEVCQRWGLPLNAGKSLVGSYLASLQGGEFDGQQGLLAHGRKRGRHLLRLSLALASQAAWPESVLRHWAGLACFAATYRRPLFSVMSAVFEAVENQEPANVFTPGALEEVLLFAALTPLAVANLRAPLAERLSCSDASPEGGGAAVAEDFARVVMASARVHPLSGGPGRFPCPGGCAARFCSLEGLGVHRTSGSKACSGDQPGSLLAFVCIEGGAQSTVLLTKVAQLGVEVKRTGFQTHKLNEKDLWDPVHHWSHYTPCETTMGRRSEGLAVRSWRFRKGLPKLPDKLLEVVRAENRLHNMCLHALESQGKREGVTVVEVQAGSWFLEWPRIQHLRHLGLVFFLEVEGKVLVHTSRRLARSFYACRGSSSSWQDWYAFEVRDLLGAAQGALLPGGSGDQIGWLRDQLGRATARLGEAASNEAVAQELRRWLATMSPGREVEHLRHLLRRADRRGSDVQLWTGELVRATRQAAPYPAFRWAWRAVSAYRWSEEAHINVLEVLAFVNLVRQLAGSGALQSTRFVHVVDSMVASAVIAKGRSSSRLLNFRLRQLAGLLLASDAYPFVVWTISSWNFADRASRWWPGRPPWPPDG